MGPRPLPQPAAEGRPLTRLGILAALPAEARALTRALPRREWRGTGRLLLDVAGVGAGAAEAAAERLVAAGATALLSWGTATALDPLLEPGILLLPSQVITLDGARLPCDEAWHGRLRAQLGGVCAVSTGALAEAGALLTDVDSKAALRRATGAAVADMESGAVARIAQRRQLPFAVLRAVADPASAGLPRSVSLGIDEAGRVRAARVVLAAAARPPEWGALLRLGRWFHLARRSLGRAARAAGPSLMAEADGP